MNQVAKNIIFIGRVQGVGFRFTAHRIALQYDLVGFVRNMPNGSVEMLAQGTDDDIKSCIEDIKETFAGCIRETKITDQPVSPACDDFKIAF